MDPRTSIHPVRRLLAPASSLLAIALLLGACTREQAEDKAKALAEQAGDKGKQLADQAGDKSKELAEQAGEKGKQLAADLWEELPSDGQLSAGAQQLLSRGASSGDSVEAWIAKGEQVAPAAVDVAKTLRRVVDSDHRVEPIIQDLADADAQRQLDARIADMPRVETIDGVSVGFKDVTQYDTAGRSTESAYLILWRRDDKLLGLVYRSKQRINVDVLVQEAPRLVASVQGVL